VSAVVVEIPGGGSFTVGDELTIIEGAMVYSGRPPNNPFFEGASLRELETHLGRGVLLRRNFDERPHQVSYAVYREVCELIGRGEIRPVKTYFLSDGLKLDPRLTTIRTSDFAKLAEKRRDSCFDFSPWTPAPSSEPSPNTEPSTVAQSPTAPAPSIRRQLKRDLAKARIRTAVADYDRPDISISEIMRRCRAEPSERRTYKRALDALRDGKDCRAAA